MRVRGDNAPSNAFSLEEQPNKPGVALVRFYENAEPFEEKRDELTISGWVKCSPSQGHFHLTHSGSIPAGYSPVVM